MPLSADGSSELGWLGARLIFTLEIKGQMCVDIAEEYTEFSMRLYWGKNLPEAEHPQLQCQEK